MPLLYSGTCKSCDHFIHFLTPYGSYYIKDSGDIARLSHPCEDIDLRENGTSWSGAVLKNRIASSATVICQGCGAETEHHEDKGLLFKFFQKDRYQKYRQNLSKNRKCTSCGGTDFIPLWKIISEEIECPCPNCNERETVFVNAGIS